MGKHRRNPDRKPTSADVGYGKPPKSSQFKPGESGNPKGRPRVIRTVAEDRQLVLNELVTLEINGRQRKLTRQTVILRTMSALAMKGDVRAARFIFDLDRRSQSADPSGAEPDGGLNAEDHALLADYMRRMEGERYDAANDDHPQRPQDGGERQPEEGRGKAEEPDDE